MLDDSTILTLQIRNDEAEALLAVFHRLTEGNEASRGEWSKFGNIVAYIKAKQLIAERELFPMPLMPRRLDSERDEEGL